MKEKKKYYGRLDLIRSLSCIMVLLYHLHIVKGGFLAVCTFLVVSGYLGCMSAYRSRDFSIRNYYLKRLQKIYLPLVVVVMLTVLIAGRLPYIHWINLRPETLSVLGGYNNFWQLSAQQDYFTRTANSPFVHFWYIAVLLQIDLLFPICFVLLKKADKLVNRYISLIFTVWLTLLSTVIFLLLGKTKGVMSAYYNTFARSFSYAAGILAALLQHKVRMPVLRYMKTYDTYIFAGYLVIWTLLCLFVSDASAHYALFMILMTIISVRLVRYAVIRSTKLTEAGKMIRWFSGISYEIYLVQYPIIYFIQNSTMNRFLQIPVIIILTILSAWLTHYLLNISWKDRIPAVIKTAAAAALVICGSIAVIREPDHAAEMKELEDRLNENKKIMDQNNQKFLDAENDEQKQWEDLLAELENEEKSVGEVVSQLPVVGVGDSVLEDAYEQLYGFFPNGYFDGEISRTILRAEDVLNDLKSKGKLGNILILCLAHNGDYSDSRCKELMDIVEDRTVYWVTAVGADDPSFNERFEAFAQDYPNIHLVRWDEASAGHPEYFYPDGVHEKGEGLVALAETIYNTIVDDYMQEYRNKHEEELQKYETEKNRKIVFYGNDALINTYGYLEKSFEKAVFHASSEYTYDQLYSELQKGMQDETLEHRIVLVFDQNAGISEDNYRNIIDLCKGHELWICNVDGTSMSAADENVTVIDFKKEAESHEEYYLSDREHYSEKGISALAEMLIATINK